MTHLNAESRRCTSCGRKAEAVNKDGDCLECERDELAVDNYAAEAVREMIEAVVTAARPYLAAADIEGFASAAAREAKTGQNDSYTAREARLHELTGRRIAKHDQEARVQVERERFRLERAEANALRDAIFQALVVEDIEIDRPSDDQKLPEFANALAENADRREWLAQLLQEIEEGSIRNDHLHKRLVALLEADERVLLERVRTEAVEAEHHRRHEDELTWPPVLAANQALLERVRAAVAERREVGA
jgi:hypothetical protein